MANTSFWTITIGPVVVVLLIVGIQIVWPNWFRRWIARKPVRARFLYEKDGELHQVSVVVLPSNSDCEVQLMAHVRFGFMQHEFMFRINGDRSRIPKIREYFADWVAEGSIGRGKPGDPPSHYIDSKGGYHIREEGVRSRGNEYRMGYKIHTGPAGVFPTVLKFIHELGDGGSDLSVRVEDDPSTPMKCDKRGHKNRFVAPPSRS